MANYAPQSRIDLTTKEPKRPIKPIPELVDTKRKLDAYAELKELDKLLSFDDWDLL